jgi:hypothetical protein
MTMTDRFDEDLMEDLAEPEGPAYSRFDDAGDLGDLGEDLGDLGDLGEDLADPSDLFLGDLGEDLADPYDLGDSYDTADQFDEAIAEALMADDADEFLGSVWKAVKKAAPIVSKIAPMLPIPGAGIIGKVADVVANAAEDAADEMDAIDDLADLGDQMDSMDPVAPVVAGLAIKKAIPAVSRLPHGTRKQLVKATAAATKHVARHHGAAAAAAMPAIVRHARKVAVRRGVPAAHLPHLVRRTAARVVRSPALVRRLAQTSRRMRPAAPGMGMAMGHRRRRHHGFGGFAGGGLGGGLAAGGFGGGARGARGVGAPGLGGMRRRGLGGGARGLGGARGWGGPGAWGGAGGSRSLSLSGPVRITIESM